MARARTILDFVRARPSLNTLEIVYIYALQLCWEKLCICSFDWVCAQCTRIYASKTALMSLKGVLAAHGYAVPKDETFTRELREYARRGLFMEYVHRDRVRENPREYGGKYFVYPERVEHLIPDARRFELRSIVKRLLEG